ncbi:MAG: hypothetical protein KAY34_06455, partial [Neisseria sp.]|nr:hypothetical protein [Neisseria sp.]
YQRFAADNQGVERVLHGVSFVMNAGVCGKRRYFNRCGFVGQATLQVRWRLFARPTLEIIL